MSWSHEDVLKAFGDLTGIRFRFVAEEMRRQATRFAENFTLQELELVILWTKRQIAKQSGNFSQASLQWRVVMGTPYGDELLKFQERLGLAEEEMKRTGWKPPFVLSVDAKATPAKLEEPAKPGKAAPTEDVWKNGAEKFRAMQAQLFQRGDAVNGS